MDVAPNFLQGFELKFEFGSFFPDVINQTQSNFDFQTNQFESIDNNQSLDCFSIAFDNNGQQKGNQIFTFF